MDHLLEELHEQKVNEVFVTALCQSFLQPLTTAMDRFSRCEQSRRSGVSPPTLERWFSSQPNGWSTKPDVRGARMSGIAALVASFNAQYDGRSGVNDAFFAFRAAIRVICPGPDPSDLTILCAVMLFQHGRSIGEIDAGRWPIEAKAAFVDDFRVACQLLCIDIGALEANGFFVTAFEIAKPYLLAVAIIMKATSTNYWFAEDSLEGEAA